MFHVLKITCFIAYFTVYLTLQIMFDDEVLIAYNLAQFELNNRYLTPKKVPSFVS